METSNSGHPVFYSPQLDGLRFIAAFLVFIHHAPSLPVLSYVRQNGWIGVDLFLCISAFLLTRLLSLEFQKTSTIRIKDFFIRRALRIWPLYFVYATFVCLLAYAWFKQDAVSVIGWWFSHLTFTNNVITALEGYSKIPFSAHLWTISLEEQFYLLIPFLLLVYFISRVPRRHIAYFGVIAILVLMSARFAFFLNSAPHPFVWVLPLRDDSFIIGALAAILTENVKIERPVLMMLLGIFLMCSVALFPDLGTHSLYQVFGYTIVSIGCVLIVVSSQAPIFYSSLLSCGVMRYLGKISYGIYVYHALALAVAVKLLKSFSIYHTPLHFLLGIILTVSISSVSYALLEKPFLRLKRRFTAVSSRPV